MVEVAYYSSHPDKKIIGLSRHFRYPTPLEKEHMRKLTRRLFPGKSRRGQRSIVDHYNSHEV